MKTKTCKHNKAVAQGVTRDQTPRGCSVTAGTLPWLGAVLQGPATNTLRHFERQREGERESGLAGIKLKVCASVSNALSCASGSWVQLQVYVSEHLQCVPKIGIPARTVSLSLKLLAHGLEAPSFGLKSGIG